MFVQAYKQLENIGLKYWNKVVLELLDGLFKTLWQTFNDTKLERITILKTLINNSPRLKVFIFVFIVTWNLKK